MVFGHFFFFFVIHKNSNKIYNKPIKKIKIKNKKDKIFSNVIDTIRVKVQLKFENHL